jgi:NADH-quinone oxidoreductase subunit N
VLSAVIDAGLLWLAILAVVFAVIGAFYYLRLVWYMYFADPRETQAIESPFDMRLVLSLNGLALLAIGLFPGFLFDLCARVIG